MCLLNLPCCLLITGGAPLCPSDKDCVKCNNTPYVFKPDTPESQKGSGCRALIGFTMVIAGIVLMASGSNGVFTADVPEEDRRQASVPYLTGGGVCLGLGALLFLTARMSQKNRLIHNPQYKPQCCIGLKPTATLQRTGRAPVLNTAFQENQPTTARSAPRVHPTAMSVDSSSSEEQDIRQQEWGSRLPPAPVETITIQPYPTLNSDTGSNLTSMHRPLTTNLTSSGGLPYLPAYQSSLEASTSVRQPLETSYHSSCGDGGPTSVQTPPPGYSTRREDGMYPPSGSGRSITDSPLPPPPAYSDVVNSYNGNMEPKY